MRINWHSGWELFRRVPRLGWIIGISALCLMIAALGIRAWLFVDLPDVATLTNGLHQPSIRILDRKGRLLYEVIGESGGRNTVVPLAEIPLDCQHATIATEDASFYSNPGVDLAGIARALWINIQGGEVLSGGSTITQQVARNLLFDPHERSERTLTRKLRESILAYRLTQHYSKDDILSLYLNQTYYGNLAYGIDAAARAYFGKSVRDLDLAECALVAGLPQSPSDYDPMTNPTAASQRQAVVIDLMVSRGYLSQDDANLALKEPLAFAAERYSIEAPHFVMAVYDELEKEIPPQVLYKGGLEVHTTLDLDWQHAAERIARRQIEILNTAKPGDPPHNATNAALVALDPISGRVLAMLGSVDYFNPIISGAVNLALSPRQPGSTLKPFTYALAFDPRQPHPWTAATMILDVRTSFVTHEGFSYVPVNYDRAEHGPVLVREALASSYNIPAVITLQSVGLDRLFTLVGSLGMTTLRDPSQYDLSLTLGGGEVRLLELTAAYAALANGGKAIHPQLIDSVQDQNGVVIYAPRPQPQEQVIDQRVAWLITDILSDNLARAPTFTTHSILQIGRPAAAKTGTTTDYRDNWTVGYTPDLVVGVWVGNTNNQSMINISGVSGAGPIWHHFMREVLKGQPEQSFVQPPGLTQIEICTLSGLLPTPECPATRREWFIDGTQPTEPDNLYKRVEVDIATGLPATDQTPAERLISKIVVDLPLQAQDWARKQGLPLLQTVAGPGANQGAADLNILSPDPQSVYLISPTLPVESQKLHIVFTGPSQLRSVKVFMDNALIVTLDDKPFETWWVLQPGQHTLYAIGILNDGSSLRSRDVSFAVRLPE